ncbi:MAG: Beta-lactamase superfamily domain protein [Euryarchaeota archaeon ADurb.Bin190]|nr:MAG: Beta-lactamase superfamily domain protein [Euryarchaeota archaeon ADurb.Bin190]
MPLLDQKRRETEITSLTVYDGAHGIGGNKIYLEEKGKGIFLDFGKNFGKYGLFYEEFLKNRDTRGIHDLMYLDLLPRLNIYRPDLIPSDLSISSFPTLSVSAVLLSHAHMDHCGNIGMLRRDIPLVASAESIVIMKGMQDCGVTSLETDTAYFSPRQPSDEVGLYLSSVAGMSYQGRDFCSTEKPSPALAAFLSRKPGQDGKRAKKLEPGRCCCLQEADLSLPFEISAHPVDHSIPGATAYILRGETTVAYTGDFRLHGRNESSSRDFIRQAKEASILITEGTRAGPSEEERTSERSVCQACRECVEDSTGLVIADFSPRNFERLESFQYIARKAGRRLVTMAKDVYMLHCLQSICGSCSTDEIGIYSEITDRSRRKWEHEVVAAHYADRYVDHASIRESPQDYILCFSFFDMKHLLDIKPEGGTYIYSACEAFNEEMEIDFRRLWQWLRRFGISSRGFFLDGKGELHFERPYHASGHASGEDIARAIEQIDPDVIVPVHTESFDWFAESFENVMAVEEGKRYEI